MNQIKQKITHNLKQKNWKNLPQNPGDTILYQGIISKGSQLFWSLGTK